jgi:hypothetical protein
VVTSTGLLIFRRRATFRSAGVARLPRYAGSMVNGEFGIGESAPLELMLNTSISGRPELFRTNSRFAAQLLSKESVNPPGGLPSAKGEPGIWDREPSAAILYIAMNPPLREALSPRDTCRLPSLASPQGKYLQQQGQESLIVEAHHYSPA